MLIEQAQLQTKNGLSVEVNKRKMWKFPPIGHGEVEERRWQGRKLRWQESDCPGLLRAMVQLLA